MPEEDGYSLLRRIRALPAKDGGSISAIALSAFQTADDRRRALAAGFDIHLGKPVAPAELLDAARALANRQTSKDDQDDTSATPPHADFAPRGGSAPEGREPLGSSNGAVDAALLSRACWGAGS